MAADDTARPHGRRPVPALPLRRSPMPHPRVRFVGLVVLAAGCGGASTPSAPVAAHAAVTPGGPAAAPAPNARDASLAYWNGLNTVPAQMAPHMRDGPA